MSAPLELIIAVTAATLIGVGSVTVLLHKAVDDTAQAYEEKVVQCDRDEVAKCKVTILGEKKALTSEERVERVEIMAERIKARLDALENAMKEKKGSSQDSSGR